MESRQRHMGTEVSITLYSRDTDEARRALAAAHQRFDQLDRTLSNFQSDSELSRLDHSSPHAHPVPVSDDLWRVMRAADRLSRQTDGAFDVTVGPLSRLWRRARREKKLPEVTRLRAAQQAVGYQHVRFDESHRSIQLLRPAMRLDLGGIAKGYALDEAFEVLRDRGFSRVLINAGGDVLVGEPPPGRTTWRVGIAPLQADQPVSEFLNVKNCAVATSGDLWQFVEIDGRRYSHLIDPRTGVGMTRRSSVTVIAASGMLADGWASALSVMPWEEGLRLIQRSHETLEARIAEWSGSETRVWHSENFARYQVEAE